MDLIAGSTPARLKKESKVIIERFANPQKGNFNLHPTVFFVDYTSRQYVYVDSNCIKFAGYPDTYFYEGGHKGFLKNTHPADYETVNFKIFPVNLEYLNKYSPERHIDLIFSHNFRFKNSAGEYVMMLQRYSYVPGLNLIGPSGVIGIVYNIMHFKNDLNIVHVIEETESSGDEMKSSVIFKTTYPVYDIYPLQNFTKRESEIVRYLAKGLDTKKIALQLSISINTVNNHRKNLLQKTGCKNTAELLAYSSRHGIT